MNPENQIKTENENLGQAQVNPMNRIKVTPLDGVERGKSYYAPFNPAPAYNYHVFQHALTQKDDEIRRLKEEINSYKASGRIMNTSWKIGSHTGKSIPEEITVYHLSEMSDDFDNIRCVMNLFEGVCRKHFNKRFTKEYVNHITAFLAKEFFNISCEEALAKLNLSGDAKDSATIAVQIIRDLVKSFEYAIFEVSPAFHEKIYKEYIARIRKLASSMNQQQYEIIAFEFIGEVFTDAKIYYELMKNQQFADQLSRFQLTLHFAVELLIVFPMLLEFPADTLTGFISGIRSGNWNADYIKGFTERLFGNAMNGSSTKTMEKPLSDIDCEILEMCINYPDGVSKKILMDQVKEESSSRFSKTILNPLVEQGYLAFTCANSHSCNQKYRITPAGVTALQSARPGRTYSLLIQTEPMTNPTVPDAQTE